MEWKDLLHFAADALMGAIGIYIATKASAITESVDRLNQSVATLLERSLNQEKRLDRLENS